MALSSPRGVKEEAMAEYRAAHVKLVRFLIIISNASCIPIATKAHAHPRLISNRLEGQSRCFAEIDSLLLQKDDGNLSDSWKTGKKKKKNVILADFTDQMKN